MMNGRASFIQRRGFLKSGLAAAGAATLAPAAVLAAEPAAPASATAAPAAAAQGRTIPTRPLGQTGRNLPILGMGGSAMVQIFARAYGIDLLPIDQRVAMVRHAFDSGIRYFDTARVYGESESIMGRGLKGVRDQCYVATKMHFPDPARVRESVETSLRQLDMDYVDCVQIHSPAIERVGFEGAMKLHAEVAKLRDEGLCRFIGLTTHVAFEDVLKMIETGGFDQVLLAYGYFRRGMDTVLSNRKIEFRDQCLAKAHELGMGIVAMKVLGANIFSHNAGNLVDGQDPAVLSRLPGAAIRWVLADERISLLNIGVSMPSDIDQNVETLSGDLRLTSSDRALLAEFSAKAYDSATVQAMKVS